jgi:hypothetical protein
MAILMPFGSWALLMLLAKSARRPIQGPHVLVYSVCQLACHCENDFACSITFGEYQVMGQPVAKRLLKTAIPLRGRPDNKN